MTALPATITVEQAGRICGLARATAYEAVYRSEIPSLRIGRRILVPVHELLRMLGIDPDSAQARHLLTQETGHKRPAKRELRLAPAPRTAEGSAA